MEEKAMAYTFGTEEWENAYGALVKERLAKVDKPYVMGTPEWVAAYEKLIQEDEEYKESARKWEGTVVIHILANPSLGLDVDIYMLMDLWHGDCRSVRVVPREVGEKGDYIITGELERWEAVMSKELDTIKGMMQGKLKLKGNLATIVRYVKASARLTELSTRIGTKFLSQLSDEEREEHKKWINEMRVTFGL
jgi:putative sterol carrier protein